MDKGQHGKDFITWQDLMTEVRWLERGYVGRILFKMVVACPKGEQFDKLCFELHWCDDALQERPLPYRILARFPNARSKSLAAALIGLCWELDNALSESTPWVEPTIGVAPRHRAP